MATVRNPNGPSTGQMSPTRRGAPKVKYDSWKDPVHEKEAIAIHHGGNSNYAAGRQPYSTETEMAQLRSWEKYHLSKKWRGIAYGYAVGQTGTVYRLRGWNNYGAHTGDLDGDKISNNKEIVPVILIMSGMANRHTATPEMLTGFNRLRNYLEETEDRGLWLYGHQEVQTQKTTCPGPNNMTWIRKHRISDTKTTSVAAATTALPAQPAETTLSDWIKEEQDNLNRAGFGTLVVDGVNGPRTKDARLQRDIAANATGIPYGVPIEIKEIP